MNGMNKRRLEQLRVAVLFIKNAYYQNSKVNMRGYVPHFCLKTLAYDIDRLYYYEVLKAQGKACNHHAKKKIEQSTS